MARTGDDRGEWGSIKPPKVYHSVFDELGTPLAITLDFQTITDHTITLRERDSTRQVRGSEDRVLTAIQSIISGTQT